MAQTSSSYSFFDNSPLYHPSVKDLSQTSMGSLEDDDVRQSPNLRQEDNHASPLESPMAEHSRHSNSDYGGRSSQEHNQDSQQHYKHMSQGSFVGEEQQDEVSDKLPLAPSPPPASSKKMENEDQKETHSQKQLEGHGHDYDHMSNHDLDHEQTPIPSQNGLSAPPPVNESDHMDYSSEFVEPKFISIPSPMVKQQVVQLQQRREQPELEVDSYSSQKAQKQMESDMSPRSQTSHHSQSHYRDNAPSPAGSVSSLLQSSSPEVFRNQDRQPRTSFSTAHPMPIQRQIQQDNNAFAPSSHDSTYSVGQPRPEFSNLGQHNQSAPGGGVSLGNLEREETASGPWGSARIQGSTGMRHSSFGSSTSPASARGESLMSAISVPKDVGNAGVIARPTPPSTTGSAVKDGVNAYAPPGVQQHSKPVMHHEQHREQQWEQQRQPHHHHHHQMHGYNQGSQGQIDIPGPEQHSSFPSQSFTSRQQPVQHGMHPPLQHQPKGTSQPASMHSSASSMMSAPSQMSSYPFSPQAVGTQSSITSSSATAPSTHRYPNGTKGDAPSPAGSGVSYTSPPPLLHNVPPPAPSAPPPNERYQMPPGVAQAVNANKEAVRDNTEFPAANSAFGTAKTGNVMSAGSSSLNPNRLSGGYPKQQPQAVPSKNVSKQTTGLGGAPLGSSSNIPPPKSIGNYGNLSGSNGGSFIVGGVKIPTSSLELPRPPSIFEEDPIPAEYRPNKRIQSADQESIEPRLGRLPEKTGSGASNYSTGQSSSHLGGGMLGQSPVRQGLGIDASNGSNNFTSPLSSLGPAVTKESVLRGNWGPTTATSILAARQSGQAAYPKGGEASYLKGGKQSYHKSQGYDDQSYHRQDDGRDQTRSREHSQSSLNGLPENRNYLGDFQSPPLPQGQQSRDRQSVQSFDSQATPRTGQFLQQLHTQVNAATERNQQQAQNWSSANSVGSSSSYQGRLGNQQSQIAQQPPHSNIVNNNNLSQVQAQIPRHILSPPVNPMSPDGYQQTNPSVGPTPDLPILSHPSLQRTKSMEQKDSEDDYYDSLASLYPTLPTDHLRSLHKFALFLCDDAMAADSAERLGDLLQAGTNNRNSQGYSKYDDNEEMKSAAEKLRKITDTRVRKWNDWVDQEDADRRQLANMLLSLQKGSIQDGGKGNGNNSGGNYGERDNETPTEEDSIAHRKEMDLSSPAVSKKSDITATRSLMDNDDEEDNQPPSPPENLLSPSPTPTYIQVAKAPKVDLVLQMPRPIVTVPTMKLDPSNRRMDDEMSTVAESDIGDGGDYNSGYNQFAGPANSSYRPVDPKVLASLLASFNRGNVNRNGGLVSGQTSPSQDIPILLHQAYAALETATNNPSLETYLTDARRNLEQKTMQIYRDADSESVSRRQLHQQQSNMYYSTRRHTVEELDRMTMDFEKQELNIKLQVEKNAYNLFENEYVEASYKDVKRQLEILGGKWYEEVRIWLIGAATSAKTTTALDYHLILECIDLLNKFFTAMEQHEHVLQNLVSERNARYLQVSIAPLTTFGDTMRAQDAERRFWADEQERQLLAKKDSLKRATEHASTIELVVADVIQGLKRKYEEVVEGINNIIFQFPPSVIPELFRRFFDYDKNRNQPPARHSDADFVVPKPIIDILRDGTQNLGDLLGLMKLAVGFQNEPQVKVCEAKCSLHVAEEHAQTAGITSPSVTGQACSTNLGKVLPAELKRLRDDQTHKLGLIQEDSVDILRRLTTMVLAFEKDPRLPSSQAPNQHNVQTQLQHTQHAWSGSSEVESPANHGSSGSYENRWGGQMQGLGSLGGLSGSHGQHGLQQQHSLLHTQQQIHNQHGHQQQHIQQHSHLGGLHGGMNMQSNVQQHMGQQQLSNTYLQQQQQQRGAPMQAQQPVPALRTMLGNLRAGGHNYGLPQQAASSAAPTGYGNYSNNTSIWNTGGGNGV